LPVLKKDFNDNMCLYSWDSICFQRIEYCGCHSCRPYRSPFLHFGNILMSIFPRVVNIDIDSDTVCGTFEVRLTLSAIFLRLYRYRLSRYYETVSPTTLIFSSCSHDSRNECVGQRRYQDFIEG
jgi:hypothetical protein